LGLAIHSITKDNYMKQKKTKPIYRIILTIPVYIAIIYRSYNFRINVDSIIFTFIYLSMICIDLYLYNKKIKDESKFK